MEEFVKPKEFRLRLAISRPSYIEARKTGIIKEVLRPGPRGPRPAVEWNANSRRFIDASENPSRFTVSEIARRKKRRLIREKYQLDVHLFHKRNKKLEAKGLPPEPMPPELLHKPMISEIEEQDVDEEEREDSQLSAPIKNAEKEEDTDGYGSDDIDEVTGSANKQPTMVRRSAEAMKQVYLAKQARLKFLKDAGILMETTAVLEEWKSLAVHMRKQLLAIPDRVAELCASMDKAVDVHKLLTEEIIHVMTGMRYEIKKANGTKQEEREVDEAEEETEEE